MKIASDREELSIQNEKFAISMKHRHKAKEWVGLGWNCETEKLVDEIIYLFGDEIYDPIKEDLCRSFEKEI